MRWLLALLFALAPSLALGAYYPTCEQTPSCVCDPGSQADQDIPVWVDDGTPAWELRTLSSHFSVGASDVSISSTFTQAGSCVGDVSGELCSNYARFSTAEVDMNAASLKVPQSTDCSGINGEGKLCWETDRELLWMGSDATAEIPATIAQSTDCSGHTGEGEACWETDIDKLTIGDGTTQVTGATASMKRCIDFSAKEITCSGSDGCLAGTHSQSFHSTYAGFYYDADDVGSLIFHTPSNLTGTTADVTLYWYATNAACNGDASDYVCWTVDGESIADGEVFYNATLGGTEVGVSDLCNTVNNLNATTFTGFVHSWDADEVAVLHIRRDADETIGSCTDNFAYYVFIIDVAVCFNVSDPLGGE